jgi:serine-type D-Ala-D-Ala carboxypeptidase (penicillin-binding protein 5/6)
MVMTTLGSCKIDQGLQIILTLSRKCEFTMIRCCFAIFFGVLFFGAQSFAASIDINAREYILVDFHTGAVLAARNENDRMPPSSMSKLMTTYMVFDALQSGRLSLDDELNVSANAWRKGGAASGGSTMFLEPGTGAKVEDLLRGIIVQSGNDACIVLAEAMSGSEENFAAEMTTKGQEIGLTNSHFTNSTGLPDDDHYMTAHDLAALAKRMILDFPEFYALYSETSFTYNGITQGNRNPLLYRVGSGADGLKTGHTSAAGYGLTASSVRNGRRLIMVANGMDSIRARDEESIKLVDWGFREFVNRELFKAGEEVTDIEVWLGDLATVPVGIQEDVVITVPRADARALEVKVTYEGPVPAPIAKDSQMATLEVSAGELDPIKFPLYATEAADRLGFIGRLRAAASYLIFGPAMTPSFPQGSPEAGPIGLPN